MISQEMEQLKRNMSYLFADRQHLATRFFAEVEFALGLAKLQGTKASGWGKLIDQAVKVVQDCLAAGKADQLAQSVEKAEKILEPIARVAKTYTIHCVGHAHIDMNWMWSWPETCAVTNDTFTTVLKLMEEFPDFCFTQSQASVYAIMREYNPELFEQIKKRVAEGRWEVAAVHWVEGDKNLAGGESLARHLLYTRRFFKENFNLNPEDVVLDWEPDTFGHAHTIPSIITRGGARRYYMCRGGRFEKPPVFWWQGPDGSRVLVNLEQTWYLNQITTGAQALGPWKPTALAMLDFCEKTGLKDWMCVYGVGDHGGGPTRRDIRMVHEMDSWPVYPNLVLTTTDKYYSILEKQGDKLPVVDQELNFEFTGCYTSQSLIKKANRYSEHYLLEAEAVATLANRVLGREYPTAEFRQAWIDSIFSHFHDILPGSGVRATRDYNQGQFQKIAATTQMIKTNALRALAKKIDTSFAGIESFPTLVSEQESTALGAGVGRGAAMGDVSSSGQTPDGPRGFVVFNTTAWARKDVVTFTIWDSETGVFAGDMQKKSFVVQTPDGKTVPAQKTAADFYWGHRFVDLAVPVSASSLGYTSYVVKEGEVPDYKGGVVCNDKYDWEKITIHSYAMENEFIAVDFDPMTGGISKLVDKTTGRDLACPENPLGVLEYLVERPGPMSSWLIHAPQERVCPVKLEAFNKGLRGPHLATVVAKAKINDSTVTITYALKAGQPGLEITVNTQWVERGGPTVGTPTLRMQFPMALKDAKGRYEIPFGSVQRDLNKGEEVPALRWADVTGKQAGFAGLSGCALLNDSKYGHSLDGSTLRLTLIRSSYEPDPLPEIGEHTIRMALVPHGKPLADATLTQLGTGFNQPLQVVSTDIHKGTLPAQAPDIVASDSENIVISSVKKAEDGDAVIIHLFETAGKTTTAKVRLDPTIIGRVKEAVEVDFLERPASKTTVKVVNNGFTVKVPSHGIACVRIILSK